jgi:glycosyltransferase involved in cell wall biosynthesis
LILHTHLLWRTFVIMANKHRILVISHAHPDFSLGGGELAAYNMFKGYQAHPDVEDVWFLARVDKGRGPTGAISLRRDNQYLWEQAILDWHMMSAANRESVLTRFADFVRAVRPTLVHTHHYAHMGVEYLRILKQICPTARILMTLHEYMAICRNNGQMIKPKTLKLCSSESPDECSQCFPEKTAEEFWLRKHFLQDHFSFVDQFVAPSDFLRQRYVAWGLPAHKISVLENGQSSEAALPARELGIRERRNRFAYFGQINPYKGVDVLLEALHTIPERKRRSLVVEIHGSNLEGQPSELQSKIKLLAQPLLDQKVLYWVGPYRPEDHRKRLESVDWVVVPSIWWENSPMVIQEAFVCGRPVICSDIGGMAEKVRHDIDGLHVSAGNAVKWAESLLRVAGSDGLWERLAAGIRRPLTVKDSVAQHLSLLRGPALTIRERVSPA